MSGFRKAAPIWLSGQSEETNVQAVFETKVECGSEAGEVRLHITAAALYKLWVNGRVAAYGPARAPHGYARIDRVNVTPLLREGTNTVRIQVAGYYCYSYYTVRQPSFLQAEVVRQGETGEEVLAATGEDFASYLDVRREQKAMRYSFQRTFTEIWDETLDPVPASSEKLSLDLKYLERGVPLPGMNLTHTPSAIGWKGNFRYEEPESYLKDRYIVRISDIFSGYKEEEIEKKPYYLWQSVKYAAEGEHAQAFGCTLRKGECLLLDFGRNHTGFLRSRVQSDVGCHYMVSFDETLLDGIVDFRRMSTINLLDYQVPAGEWENESFEAYGLRYACVMVTEGELCLKDFGIRDYSFPMSWNLREYSCGDRELGKIYRAAVETFRQNTVDIYMDCPTRERAGWLCDSYFTSIAEMAFTGRNVAERCFMENYRLYPGIAGLPEGMLPMCYPADHPDGKFIPQWAMWFLLELEEFLERSPDVDPLDYKEVCDKLMHFFVAYENEWGLLEKLPSWNFVEWSRANEWVWDVNYPTNMLYGKTCEVVGRIYGDEALVEKGRKIRKTVAERAFRGTFFCDHAVRDEAGELRNVEADISEVCQYYAVMFLDIDFGDPFYAKLVQAVSGDFSPVGGKLPDNIAPANDFIGYYMRMNILFRWGRYAQLKEEIKALFGGMTDRTGTLWEKRDIHFSLNHGFASYVGALIQRMEQFAPANWG